MVSQTTTEDSCYPSQHRVALCVGSSLTTPAARMFGWNTGGGRMTMKTTKERRDMLTEEHNNEGRVTEVGAGTTRHGNPARGLQDMAGAMQWKKDP